MKIGYEELVRMWQRGDSTRAIADAAGVQEISIPGTICRLRKRGVPLIKRTGGRVMGSHSLDVSSLRAIAEECAAHAAMADASRVPEEMKE